MRGLSEPTKEAGPVAAAKAHLAAPLYHLDPADLEHVRTVVDGTDETVRLAQRHRGLPVLGAQYLVHFRKDGDRRTVTGAGGRFLTELDVDPTPKVTEQAAARLARERLSTDREARAVTKELVVIPRGKGLLAWHVTLTGVDPSTKLPMVLDGYVDAHSGRPLFVTDRAHTVAPAEGSGRTSHGRDVTLNVHQREDGAYELRDRSRPMWDGTTGEILTYDAAGADYQDIPELPPADEVARSSTPAFGPEHTESGVVDAHWGAGKVYEYYKKLGRDSIDGQGGTIHSVTNITVAGGIPYPNARWDGTKMIYGAGGNGRHPFSAPLDVVGHEMTHGVIEHSAGLLHLGQSGALHEGLADYFGNAVQLDTLGIPMDDPDASLIAETLCTSGTPAECAFRDLDNDLKAADDYIGRLGGGPHDNGLIFTGALWEVRKELGARFDKVVYKALSEYMTPLDGFTDTRRAVESAALAAGLTEAERRTIAGAFDRHGITPGWEADIPTDSDVVVDGLTYYYDRPALAGDTYVVTNSLPDDEERTTILTGSLRGGEPTPLSDGDSWDSLPATDGERAAWVSYDPAWDRYRIRSRPVDGGSPSTLVSEVSGQVLTLAIGGDAIAWSARDPETQEIELWLKQGTAAPVMLTAAEGVQGLDPSINGRRLAYLRAWYEGEARHSTPVVRDLDSGEETLMPEVPPTGSAPSTSTGPVMTSEHVVWLFDADGDGTTGIMRAGADGTGATAIVPDGPQAPRTYSMDANDEAATIAWRSERGAGENAELPKLFQVPLTGGQLTRYSCNRGEQDFFASGEGTRVLWIDGTAGRVDLVTRSGPARTC